MILINVVFVVRYEGKNEVFFLFVLGILKEGYR